MVSRSNGRQPKRARKGGKKKSSSPSLPPPFNSTIKVSHVYRFRCATSVIGAGVSIADIFGAIGGMVTTANSLLTSFASSFRLKKFVAWPPQVAGADLVYINWSSAAAAGFVEDKQIVDTLPDGITVTRAMVARPPANSLLRDWIASAATPANVCYITCPAGAIIDMHVEFTVSNCLGTLQNTIATGLLGQVFYLALDGPSTNKLQPFGIPTTH
jgi:hypothetical protein